MTTPRDVLIVIPIYNDWKAVTLLLERLDGVLAAAGIRAGALLVDDGSTEDPPAQLFAPHGALGLVEILRLRRNLGHQRAIATGLCYAHDHLQARAVVVMDGDGEDSPEDVPRLLQRLDENGGRRVVFAERTRRSESLSFRVFYGAYRLLHFLLTGIPVRVGNFSAVPFALVRRLVVVSDLWNHYAAAVFKARVPREAVATVRGTRLSGQSRMNFVALLAHGLGALSVHAELIGVRLLAATCVLVALVVAVLAGVVALRLGTSLAIPGWASTIGSLLLVFLVQAVGFAAFFAFLVLHGRAQPGFIPIRDYVYFIDEVRAWPQESKR
jgi:glycosyltransferase involved in cell wall biosynthesis